MKLKKILSKNFKVIGLSGILSSWFTIGLVWAGVATIPFIGFFVTGSLFGLALIGHTT